MNPKRILAILLLAALLLPACTKSGDTDPPTTSGAEETTVPEETTDPNLRANHMDKLPAELNFGGKTVRTFFRGEASYLDGTRGSYWLINDICGSDNIGDPVSDAVWVRNKTVEERLGVKLEWEASGGGSLANDRTIIKNTVMSAADDFSCLLATGNTTTGVGLNPYMRDMATIPYIDYESPWWWEFANEALSVDGKTRQFIVGDMLLTDITQTGAMYFNKEIYRDRYGDPDEMYRLTVNGKLTHDKIYELVAGAYKDLNGDGVRDDGDIYGLFWSTGKHEELSHWFVGCDLDMYERTDGKLTITMNNDRTVAAVESLYRLMNENSGSFSSPTGLIATTQYFSDGHCLFFLVNLNAATSPRLRDMNQEYGILPVPKLDEAQTGYVAYVHDSGSVLGVPKHVSDEMFAVVGATLEALCGEAHRTYIDTVLETMLKSKYSPDALSGQCIDIIMSSLRKNTLMEYAQYTAGIINSCLYEPAKSAPNTFASSFQKVGPAAQQQWDKAVADLIASQQQ